MGRRGGLLSRWWCRDIRIRTAFRIEHEHEHEHEHENENEHERVC
jgi:hypothetical protein